MNERELIARVLRSVEPLNTSRVLVGPGDDAAVVRAEGVQVVTVDQVVEGVHFALGPDGGPAAGHRALHAALSDIAAMGAAPGECYVALTVPPGEGEKALALARELAAQAAAEGVALAGGDVSSGPVLAAAVTVTGWAASADELVGRGGGRAGDLVCVTGELGGARSGLALQQGTVVEDLAPEVEAGLLERHLRPRARMAAGRALALAGATAMIDLSDGLATDALHVARASGISLEIELESVPVQPGVPEVARALGHDAAELAATGGDDHELLACFAPERRAAAQEAAAQTGVALTWLGGAVAGDGVAFARGGAPLGRALTGYEHRT